MIPKPAPLHTLWHSCPSKVRRNPRRTFAGKKPNTWCRVWFFWASDLDSGLYMPEEDGLGLDSPVLFFMKSILLQDCLSLRAQETNNVNTEFACGSELVSRKTREGMVEKRMFGLCLSSSKEGKNHSLFRSSGSCWSTAVSVLKCQVHMGHRLILNTPRKWEQFFKVES